MLIRGFMSAIGERAHLAELQEQNTYHSRRMVVGAAVTLAAFLGCLILGAYAHDDCLRIGNLSDQLKTWNFEKAHSWYQYGPEDGPDIQSQIDHLTSVGYQNLGFSITLLVTAIAGFGYTAY